VSYYVQNADTFYVTVKNMYASAAVTVYQAQMTER